MKSDLDSLIFANPDSASKYIANNPGNFPEHKKLLELAKVESILGNGSLSLKYALDALANCSNDVEASDVHLFLLKQYRLLSKVEEVETELNRLDYLQQFFTTAIQKAAFLTEKGQFALQSGAIEKARDMALNSLVILKGCPNSTLWAQTLALAGEVFFQLGNNEVAKSFYSRALKMSNANEWSILNSKLTLDYAKMLYAENAIDSMMHFVDKSLSYARLSNSLIEQRNVFLFLYTYSNDQGLHVQALEYYKQYKFLDDQSQKLNENREIATFQAVYEAQKSKTENLALKAEAEKNDIILTRRNRTIGFFIVGVVILVIMLIVVGLVVRKVRNVNAKLLVITKELRDSKATIEIANKNLAKTNEKLLKTQAALQKEKEIAEKASKAKDVFLSSVTHELRTPLNAILGITQELIDQQHDPKQDELFEIIKFSGENLLALVNDILDYSKIESGKVELESIPFNFYDLLNKIQKALGPRARLNGDTLHLKYTESAPQWVIGDPVRIGQVFNNFLSNAIKFTENGKVTINIRVTDLGDGSGEFYCQIADEGIGIPADKIQSIFERFTQASADTTRKYGGTGLGLAITKRLLDQYKTTVIVQSELGKGSVFSFKLILPIGEAQVVRAKENQSFLFKKGLKVLVAEDNPMNQRLIKRILETQSIDFDIVPNGLEACEKTKSKQYGIVLMDIHMPEMDGLQAVKVIRSWEDSYFKSLPIMALTGSTVNEKAEILRKGFTEYLQKPYTKEELLTMLMEHQNLV